MFLRISWKQIDAPEMPGVANDSCWQDDAKHAPLANFALDFDTPALVFDRPPGNCEAQAVPPFIAGAGFVHPVESLEDFLLILWRDTRSLSGHFDTGVVIATKGANDHARLRR